MALRIENNLITLIMMKKIYTILCMGLAMIMCSCEPDADQNFDDQTFKGTVSVDYKDATYDNNDIIVEVEEASEGLLDITIHSIKFVPQMPVTIDVTFPNVPYTKSKDNITFFIDTVVPTMGPTPVEKYTSKSLAGLITSKGGISFTVQIADYPTRYVGTRIDD